MAKILLVEDDSFIQKLIVLQLEDKQHQVLVATNGRDGISLAQSEHPDLILMDLRLPELDGWEATQFLKTSPSTDEIPILVLTAQSISAAYEKFDEVTCDDYVQKPINFDYLFTKIDSLTNGRKTPPKVIA